MEDRLFSLIKYVSESAREDGERMETRLVTRIKEVNESAREDRYRTHRNLDAVYEQLIWIVGEIKGISKRLDALEEKAKPEVKPEAKPKNTVDNSKLFLEWRKDRVRMDKDGGLITLTDMWRSFRYWYDESPKAEKKLSLGAFSNEIQKVFGYPKDGKIYSGLFVFNTEEDVQAHDESKTLP